MHTSDRKLIECSIMWITMFIPLWIKLQFMYNSNYVWNESSKIKVLSGFDAYVPLQLRINAETKYRKNLLENTCTYM